jgi:hypothetical protein
MNGGRYGLNDVYERFRLWRRKFQHDFGVEGWSLALHTKRL